ncbi:riboflavin transporter FmnP [Paraliobacillus quinghaiensis]|uniref:Riboflavin transporter n=1 Tax=Paraliobacillus quinghaiensis TaxID=470815 RepID=A0A917TTT3_9BACI|nr:ECF transporter S component [Paraliobacillus quinghaiensis]GGM37063.1 riboflavin transporter FmnP [Paraliobacillus quinghaiensis]
MQKTKRQSSNLLKLIIIALLSTISLVLLFINFPLPFLPTYLKIDFSEVPALIAAILFTPMAGVVVEAIKNLLYVIFTGASDPVGVVANFAAGTLFVVPVAMFYHKFKGKKSLISGLAIGTIAMTLGMGVLNYFIILPAYGAFIGWDTMSIAVKLNTVLVGVIPFNVVKGVILAVLFIPLFIKLKPWIEQKKATIG